MHDGTCVESKMLFNVFCPLAYESGNLMLHMLTQCQIVLTFKEPPSMQK